MNHDHVECFAQLLVEEHQGLAETVAMRRAQHFNRLKDFENCRIWLRIADRIRQLPNSRQDNRQKPLKDRIDGLLEAGAC